MWYMHRTENPANEVQLLESPLKNIGMTITEHEDEIIYKLKLDKGQLVQMNVQKETYMDTTRYFICLFINKRGKGYQMLHQTGHAGIEGLLWAKEMLIDLIEHIRKIENKKHVIHIFWDDARRRDVYIRGLKDIGFKVGYYYRWKCLLLTIPKVK